jgi:methionyl-tRNA formyltransferase
VEYVYDGLMHLGAQLCLETLETIVAANGQPETIAQENALDGSPIKPAPKIFKETCKIDWTKTAKQVYDFVRGLSPVPGAWTTLVAPDGKETVMKIYKSRKTGQKGQGSGLVSIVGKTLCVSAADELLELVEVQLAGKKRMAARDFLNGMKDLENYHVK